MKKEIDFTDKNMKFRIFAGIIMIVIWAIYITARLTTENNAVMGLYLGIISLIVFIISFFSKQISNAFTNEDEKNKEIKSMNDEDLRRMENLLVMKNFWTWIKRGSPLICWTKTINGNIISIREVELVHERQIKFDNKYKKTDRVTIIINSTFPKVRPSILPTEWSEKIEQATNDKAMSPYAPTTIRKSKVGVDEFHRPTQEIEEVNYSEEKNEEKGGVVA